MKHHVLTLCLQDCESTGADTTYKNVPEMCGCRFEFSIQNCNMVKMLYPYLESELTQKICFLVCYCLMIKELSTSTMKKETEDSPETSVFLIFQRGSALTRT